MSISSELMGKLGGAELRKVEVPPLEITGNNKEYVVLSEIVPEGEKWLVVFEGKSSASPSPSNITPFLRIGDYETYAGGTLKHSGVVSGSYEVAVNSKSYSREIIEGTIYILEI